MVKKQVYLADNIQALRWDEHIRKRPGMYIGSVDLRGFMKTLKGFFSQFLPFIKSDSLTFEFRNENVGILTFENVQTPIRNNWSRMDQSQFSAKTFELDSLNALSSKFTVRLFDEQKNKIHEQNFEKGINLNEEEERKNLDCAIIEIEFELDKEIWTADFSWNENYIISEIRDFAFFYKKIKFDLKCQVENEPCRMLYNFKNGLQDRMDLELLSFYPNKLFENYHEQAFDDFSIEIAFAYRAYSNEEHFLKSYVNSEWTRQDGTHVDGFLKGIINAIKMYIDKNQKDRIFKISKKKIKGNLIAVLNIKMDEPLFRGCTKWMLGNKEVIKPISALVSNSFLGLLEKDEESALKLIGEFEVKNHSNA